MKKTIISILTIFVLCIPCITATASDNFASAWAKPEIEKALELEFIPFELQSNYKNNITRAEFAKIALHFAAMQYDTSIENFFKVYSQNYLISFQEPIVYKEDVFTDINDYYINMAYAVKIIGGKGDGIFDPNSPITRQEAAVMLFNTYRLYGGYKLQEKGLSFNTSFTDANSVAEWAQESVMYMYQWNVMNGVDNNLFSPIGYYTREQCIATLIRLYENGPDSDSIFHGNIPSFRETEENPYSFYGDYDKQEVEAFAKNIKDYILADDKNSLSAIINYPINVMINGDRTPINSSAEFIDNYSNIVTSKFKNAISNASVVDMFINYMGIMVGNGEIWFGRVYEKEGLWIYAINN